MQHKQEQVIASKTTPIRGNVTKLNFISNILETIQKYHFQHVAGELIVAMVM